MNNIFLAPMPSKKYTKENFDSVLYDRSYLGLKISFNFVEPFLNPEEGKILSKCESLKVWGVSDRHWSAWYEMGPGDYMLFCEQKNFCYSAKVIMTKCNQQLAEKVWVNGEDAPYLFFLDNLKETNIPLETISDQWGLGLGGWRSGLRQFMFLGGTCWGSKNIMEKFGSIENFIDHYALPIKSRGSSRSLFSKIYHWILGLFGVSSG